MSKSNLPEKKSSRNRINTLWKMEQNKIYIRFLQDNRQYLQTEQIRRKHCVFVNLSKKMTNRTSDQCRSHHQKMVLSHKSIDKIISHLRIKIEKQQTKIKKIQISEDTNPHKSQQQILQLPLTSSLFYESESKMTCSCQKCLGFDQSDIFEVINLKD